jgi:hypothetical protein
MAKRNQVSELIKFAQESLSLVRFVARDVEEFGSQQIPGLLGL